MQVDLTGGYYDAGDNVKFNLPMAFSVALLAWDVVEFGDALRGARQLGHTLNAVRWGTDYLLKCNTGHNKLWVQVSVLIMSISFVFQAILNPRSCNNPIAQNRQFFCRLVIRTLIITAGKDRRR